jgi:hypothetical protein
MRAVWHLEDAPLLGLEFSYACPEVSRRISNTARAYEAEIVLIGVFPADDCHHLPPFLLRNDLLAPGDE